MFRHSFPKSLDFQHSGRVPILVFRFDLQIVTRHSLSVLSNMLVSRHN